MLAPARTVDKKEQVFDPLAISTSLESGGRFAEYQETNRFLEMLHLTD